MQTFRYIDFDKNSDKDALKEIKKIINERNNVNDYDTALAWASYYGKPESVIYLINIDANVKVSDNRAIKWVCYKGHLEIIKYPNWWTCCWMDGRVKILVDRRQRAIRGRIH